MNNKEIKKYIAEQISQDVSLNQIQDDLSAKGHAMTFMELKLLLSEIDDLNLEKLDKKESNSPAANEETTLDADASPDSPPMGGMPQNDPDEVIEPDTLSEPGAEGGNPGKTTVAVSKLARPGAVASGSVSFGSGVTADWVLDQMGRLGLEKSSGQPNEQDLKEFQQELQKALTGV